MTKRAAALLAILATLLIAFVATHAQASGLPQYLFAQPTQQHDHNSITLYGEIDDAKAAEIVTAIHEANREAPSDKPLWLLIDSNGGSVAAGGKIIDAMIVSRRPIYTVNMSFALSMGAIIHSYGVKRYMLPHAGLMFHWATAGIEGALPQLRSRIDFMERQFARYEAHIAERSKVGADELHLREGTEWWLLADEALARGLIDAVIDIQDFPAK